MKSLYEIRLILKAGKSPEALLELRSYLQQFPNDIDGWLLLAQSVDTKDRKLDCYQRILKIDPTSQVAQENIHKLNSANQEISRPETVPPLKTQVIEPKNLSSPIPAKSQIPYKPKLSEKPIAQTVKHPSKSASSIIITVVAIATTLLCVLVIVFFLFLRSPAQSLRIKAQSMPNNIPCMYSDFSFSNIAYDVRQTDSIVSPYIGTISGIFVNHSVNGAVGGKVTLNFTITLTYQDGKWVPKLAEFTSPDIDTGRSNVQPFLEATKNMLFDCLK